MKTIARMILVFLLGVLAVSGCATISQGNGPQPGDAVFFHHNEGVYSKDVLFPGNLSKDDLFAINSATGGLIWAEQPLGKFKLGPAISREFPRIGRLNLRPNTDYTLYILWTRFDGYPLGEDVLSFRTYVDPCRDVRVGRLGGRTCASVIVDLPRMRVGNSSRFGFHKTLYVGDWIRALVGF
ncbi:hypothetical protein KKH07_03095 [Patescibacteria group bacterium]|nr:hypothetical protein [Patescibacteria group bacterium]MBU1563943.1 hypothetical protein [Patescibacteria group bacterium]MBU2068282.1 hypothetical protein [Patescibacteria group bacterium]